MQRLKNKVAVITGGNSGIGKGIAKHFYNEGAKVVILGRNQKTLDEISAELNHDILAIQSDVTETSNLENIYKKVTAHFGKIDILIANAGTAERIHVSKVTEKNFDEMVNTNYRGTFFTVQKALAYLNTPASAILIASSAAHRTLKNHSTYSSAKAAIVKLAQNFANDLAEKNIRVNSISPGYITTPIFDKRLKTDSEYLAKRIPFIPLHRIGDPQDIANAALFLGSQESSYITGTDILIDGGYAASFYEP